MLPLDPNSKNEFSLSVKGGVDADEVDRLMGTVGADVYFFLLNRAQWLDDHRIDAGAFSFTFENIARAKMRMRNDVKLDPAMVREALIALRDAALVSLLYLPEVGPV